MITRKLSVTAKIDGSVEENLKAFGFSTRICVRLKKSAEYVRIGGVHKFMTDQMKCGQVVDIVLDEDVSPIAVYDHPVDIVYEDLDIAVINKSPDIAVLATNAHYGVSLMNALAKVWGDYVFHPINRLDRGTSGLMAVAKNCLAHSIVSATIAGDTEDGKAVRREYLAIVHGNVERDMTIDYPIGMPYATTLIRGVDYVKGKDAKTICQVVEYCGDYTLVRLRLTTGRTHQIRVHMSHIGHPLAGDDLYGGLKNIIDRPALHSAALAMTSPISKDAIMLSVDMPSDMLAAITAAKAAKNRG